MCWITSKILSNVAHFYSQYKNRKKISIIKFLFIYKAANNFFFLYFVINSVQWWNCTWATDGRKDLSIITKKLQGHTGRRMFVVISRKVQGNVRFRRHFFLLLQTSQYWDFKFGQILSIKNLYLHKWNFCYLCLIGFVVDKEMFRVYESVKNDGNKHFKH